MTGRARPILIEWQDSCHVEPGAWVDADTAAEATSCGVVTVGWRLEDEGDDVVIASNRTEQGHVSGVFVIPKACIIRQAWLAPGALSPTRSLRRRGRLSSWLFGEPDG